MIVHLNPIERDDVPDTAPKIMDRVNEISFNASLLQEIRAIAFVQKLIEQDMLKPEYRASFKNVLLHSIRADKALKDFSLASKFSTDMDFLIELHHEGRSAMDEWLGAHIDDLGRISTVDLRQEFLCLDEHIRPARGPAIRTQKKKA